MRTTATVPPRAFERFYALAGEEVVLDAEKEE
jgi:hypothetical protein